MSGPGMAFLNTPPLPPTRDADVYKPDRTIPVPFFPGTKKLSFLLSATEIPEQRLSPTTPPAPSRPCSWGCGDTGSFVPLQGRGAESCPAPDMVRATSTHPWVLHREASVTRSRFAHPCHQHICRRGQAPRPMPSARGAPSTHGGLPNLPPPHSRVPPGRRVAQVGAAGTAPGCPQPHRAQLPPPARTHREESGAGRGGRKSSEAGAGAAGPAARRHASQRQPRERRGNAAAESRSWSLPSSIFVRAEEVAEPGCRRHLLSKARLGSEPRAWRRRHPAWDGATVTPRDGITLMAPQSHTQHPRQLATGLRVRAGTTEHTAPRGEGSRKGLGLPAVPAGASHKTQVRGTDHLRAPA